MWFILVRLFRSLALSLSLPPSFSIPLSVLALMQWGFSYSFPQWKNVRFDCSPIEMCVIRRRRHRWRQKGRSFYMWCEKRTVVASNAWGLHVMQSPQMNSSTIFTIYLPDSNGACLLMWCILIGANKQLDMMTESERKGDRESSSCCHSFVVIIFVALALLRLLTCGAETKQRKNRKSVLGQSSGTCDTKWRLYSVDS